MNNFVVLFLIAIAGMQEATIEHGVWLDERDGPIRVPFETNGYTFFRGSDGELGEPVEAFLKLVAVKDDRRTILPRTTSLRGYVKLKNDGEALAFVDDLSAVRVARSAG